MPTTSPVDVDAMTESEFLDFVIGSLQETACNLNRAVDLARKSTESLRESTERLQGALGIAPPKPRLALVKDPDDA